MLIQIRSATTPTISSRKTTWENFIIRASSCPLTLFLYHLEGDVYTSLKITCSPLKFLPWEHYFEEDVSMHIHNIEVSLDA